MPIKSTVYLLFLVSLSLFSQELTITGTVTDKNKTPIAFANVVLLNETGDTLINGTVSDENGFFAIEGLNSGDFILKVSYLGYDEHTVSFALTDNKTLENIVLEENNEELESVVLLAERPTVRRMVDRLVFNVENSTLSNSNALDVLKHAPGVFVNDGKITVKNSEPVVYINDRRVHLSSSEVMQLLEGTTATNIKSVEVITNPPARYEAEGGAVINIVTSKNMIAGYNGSVFGNYRQGSEYPKYSFGTSHFFKTEKLNAYLNYSINPKKDYSAKKEFINFINNDQIFSSWKTDYSKTKKTSNQNINASIDFELDSRNSIDFSTNILLSPRNNTKSYSNSKTEVFNYRNDLDSIFNTINRLVEEINNFAYTLNYIHKFRGNNEKISFSSHYTNYSFSSFQDVNTNYFYANTSNPFRENRFQTFSSQKIALYTGQIDYELHTDTSIQFETGLKISNINSKNLLSQFVFINNEEIEDLDNSNTFLYKETNYAAYASFSKDLDKWSLKTGVRVEYTNLKGNSKSPYQITKSDYIKFFPSIHVLHKLNERNELFLNYKKRIFRPNYSQLNPFKYYLTDNSYISGDPNLKPQIDDVFTFGYTFNKKHTLELYYRYEKDPTLEIVFQDNNNNILKYINTNIKRSIFYSLDFTSSASITNNWNLYLLTSAFYYKNQFFALESGNELKSNDKWSLYANIDNYFSFLKDNSLTMSITSLYISPLADGPSVLSGRFNFDINLIKSFWKNKASLSIGVIDIFNTKNYSLRTKYLNQDVFLQSEFENRLFTIGFNYKFGNEKLSVSKNNYDSEERNRLKNENEKD